MNENSQPFILKAKWISPMTAPVMRDGAVLIADGKIQELGDAKSLVSKHPGIQVLDLGESILLPGLINAHTHLELSDHQAGDSPRGSFADWILGLRGATQAPEAATERGIAQCLRFGVTCAGDITQQADITRPIIARSSLRCVSYGEVLGLAKRRGRFDELLPRALDHKNVTSKLRIGLSPHAPYTVDLDGFRECLKIATQNSMPLATHLAENPDETDFLESQSGLFRRLWEQLGSWDDGVKTFKGSPIAMAKAIGLLDYPTLLAHVNYCGDAELELLSRGRASVIYCPRTHRYFGHPPHRWREMLGRGINVAIGTDSCASSPDLNLVDELRLLHHLAPEMSAQSLWEMVTIRAAQAIQMQSEIGSLEQGKRADLVAYNIKSDDPLMEILKGDMLPNSVWIDGEKISSAVTA